MTVFCIYTPSPGRGGRSRIIGAKRVFGHFGIRIDRTLAFNTFEVQEGPMLVLDFSKAATVGAKIAISQACPRYTCRIGSK